MDKSVEQLHRAIVSAIRQTRGNDFTEPVTVSQIYQQLMPYRTARTVVGFEMNADYEYALLRLLAGEGDLTRIEPAEVREILRGELEMPNPNVSLFRDYANCDVWISAPPAWLSDVLAEPELELPGDAEEVAEADVTADSAPRPATPAVAPAPAPEPAQKAAPAPAPGPAPASKPAPTPAPTPAQPLRCSFCAGELPRRVVNFCPFCGHDLSRRACAGCGETLEPRWHFCANCGTAVESFDPEAN